MELLTRYQFFEGSATNSPPNTPTISAGTPGATSVTLTGSAFSDPDVGDTHAASQWQVTTSADTTYATPVISTGDDATHKTSYTATGLTASTAYRARVRYKDSAGNYSSYSTSVTFTTGAPIPATPANLALSIDGAGMHLTWNRSTNYASYTDLNYIVERSLDGSSWGTLNTVADGPSPAYLDTTTRQGTLYYYRVYASSAVAGDSAPTSAVSGTAQGPDLLPTVVSASADTATLTVTFSEDVVGVLAGQYTLNTGHTLSNPVGNGSGGAHGTVWTFDAGEIAEGETLTLDYAGSSTQDDTNNLLAPFTGLSVTNNTPDTTAPATPTGLAATNGDTQVVLNWTANTEPDLSDYRIYHSTTAGGTYTLLATVTAPTVTYTHTGLTNGSSHYYKITARDATGNESAQSAYVLGSPTTPDTTAPTVTLASDSTGATLNLTFSEAVTGVSAADYALTGSHTLSAATGSGTAWTMTITPALAYGDVVTGSYTGTATIDAASNPLATYSGKAVTNNVPAPSGNAEGYYAKRAKMLLRAGPNNLASYSNLDSDTTTLDETNLQAAMDWADGYVDTRALVLGLTADTGATGGHMLATTNTYYARVSALASDIAVAYLYSARGFTGDTQQTVEGQMADMDAKARKELDEILDAARVTQAQDAGSNGAEVITVGGCASARCNVVLPVWGWW